MADHPPLVRQWIILRKLAAQHFGATVSELAEELGVNAKTIRRDLQTFQGVGFPLVEERGEHARKTWRLRTVDGRPELSFAIDEALALYVGRRFLDPLTGTYLGEAAEKAFQKIRRCLGPAALKYLDKMAGSLHQVRPGASDYSEHAVAIDNLLQAIEDSKVAMISYQSLRSTEPVTYEVHPYALVQHRGSLYLVAWSRDHDEVRHFKVDRMQQVDVTNFPFQRPDDFDVRRHFANSFGVFQGDELVRVVVRFLPPVVRYVQESQWHESQKAMLEKDGSLRCEFQLSHTEEILRWILSFGRHAIVLEPDELRQRVVDELAQLANLYNGGSSRAQRATPSRAKSRT